MKWAVVLIVVALCASGCGSPPSTIAGASGAATQTSVGSQPTDGAASPGGLPPAPIPNNDPHCEAYVPTKTPLSTAWVDQQEANGTCNSNPPAVTVASGVPSASILYAVCTPVGNTPLACTLTVDMQTCAGGYWTKLCQSNSDCPAGTLCVSAAGVGDVPATIYPRFGTCAKECDTAGSGQCGRCGLVCNTSTHVCMVPIVPPDAGVAR